MLVTYFLDPLSAQIVSRKSNYSWSNEIFDQISSFKKACFNTISNIIGSERLRAEARRKCNKF